MATKTHHGWHPRHYWLYDGYNGHGLELLKRSTGALRLDRFRTGVAVNNWSSKIQNGVNATSDMTAEYSFVADEKPLISKTLYRINSGNPWVRQEHEGRVIGYYTSLPVWVEYNLGAESRAKSKAFKAIRELEIKMQGLTFLGELRETLRMLRRPAEGLQDLIAEYLTRAKTLKRGKGRGGARNFDQAVSKLWLEYAFGWTPLLMDIQDARNAFNSLLERERIEKFSVGAKMYKNVGPTYLDQGLDHCPHHTLKIKNIHVYEDVVRFRGAVKAQAVTTARDRFARFGFDPKQFIPTAWELLPWSFLVDYFANIGDMLDALVTDTSKVIWVSKSRVRTVTRYGEGYIASPATAVGSSNVSSHSSTTGWIFIQRRYVQRWANPGLTLPELSFRLPMSSRKLLNIGALVDLVSRSVTPQPIRNRNWRI